MPAFFSSETSEKHLGRAGIFPFFRKRLTAQARNCLGGQACNEPFTNGREAAPDTFSAC